MRAPSAKLADPNLSLTELATTIGDLWFALNNCYTLNPRHRDEQRGKTQLDQVADRQPQILLINIGSNEGLFMAGFAGDFSDQTIDHPGDSYYCLWAAHRQHGNADPRYAAPGLRRSHRRRQRAV